MSVPNTSELDDDQIEALIRKLSAIKGSAPELIAALEAEASSRQANKGRGRGGSRGKARTSRSHSYEDEEEEEFEDDDYEEEDDDEESDSEEDDEFDEDGPCVGYGYSDEVSVISEMTTPTVVSNIHVPAEERYDEIHQGYNKKSNKPDLLSQVNRANAAKGKKGPAALDQEKRNKYASKLGKISETAETAAVTKPKTATAPKTSTTKKGPPARKPSGDEQKGATAGIKKSSSRGLKSKKPSTGSKQKSNHSQRSTGSKKSDNSHSVEHADAFGDDWHKSLNSGDVKGTDDDGFPFDFGDNNAFAESSNSFFKKKGGGGGEEVDAFDPFGSSDAFESNNASFGTKKKSAPARERRASTASKSTRPKVRDGSPRRKGTR